MTDFLVNYDNLPFPGQTAQDDWRTHPDWFNWRCEILLTRNQEAIKNKKVLDLASHVGALTYGCLKLGAKHVTGVEGSDRIRLANEYLTGLGYGPDYFSLVQDDIFNYLSQVKRGEFDTVLCFGFLYHTARQLELFREIKRIAPSYLILDTMIQSELIEKASFISLIKKALFKRPSKELPCLVFRREKNYIEEKSIGPLGLVAFPTKSFIELLLEQYGFKYKQLSWDKEKVRKYPIEAQLAGYLNDKRVSYIAQLYE